MYATTMKNNLSSFTKLNFTYLKKLLFYSPPSPPPSHRETFKSIPLAYIEAML
jgi:hypothetical protein